MNPVIQREFFGILRSPRAFAMLLALTLAFSAAIVMKWPADGSVDLSGQESIEVFRIFVYGLLAGVVFLVPAFPSTSIVNEKNSGTLALLLNSPLKPISIYLGKVSGVLMFSLLVLLCSLPASAACYAMGGIELVRELGLLYLILLLLVLQYVTLGLMVSSFVQSTDAGVRITYTIVLGLFFLTLLPSALIRGAVNDGWLPVAAQWVRNLSPLPTIMEILGQGGVGTSGLSETTSISRFLVLSLASSALFAIVTISRLNYRIFDGSRAQGVMTQDRGLFSRMLRRILFIVDPQRRKRGIPWFLNPVMVKEFRSRRFGRLQWMLRLVSVCALSSMVLTFLAATSVIAWGVDTVGGLLVILQVVLVIVLTPSLASGLISGERDSGGWDLLRMTPLSAFKIVRGKILSVLWTLALVLMATLPGYVVMIMIEPKMTMQVQLVLVCLAFTAIYALAVSAAVGSLFRSTAVSTAVTYVVVAALFLSPLLVWLGRDAPFGHETVNTALLLTPVGAALNVIEMPGFESYDLLPMAWWVSGFISLLMFGVLGIQVWRLSRAV
jgi:ABC-type transport system involved in multi-copper enzyme maturation permease subunit